MSDTLLFFSGAAMDPQVVHAAFPDARFIARARVTCAPAEIADTYASAIDFATEPAVWGIVVRATAAIDGPVRAAVTDEGSPLTVVIAELPLLGGEAAAALAAALYWELPPAYTFRLREAAGVAAPEAEGGWETMNLGTQPPAG